MAKVTASGLILTIWVGLLSHNVLAQQVSCRTNYYAVKGESLREIHQSLRQARPWKAGHDGFTVWSVSWRFSTTMGRSVCRMSAFGTTATITITLPRWVAPTNATDLLKTEWDRYIKALGQHEYGHAQFALAAAGEIHKRVKEAGEDANCESLKQRINGLCESTVQKYKGMDETYDQRTEHGATQGARLGRGGRPERPN
jgi:predicted secreted Zn-dependent protease